SFVFFHFAMQIADQISYLNALSPLDGRYAARGDALRGLLSEAGFMAHRVEVEVAWLVALSDAGLPELPPFTQAARSRLAQLVRDFSESDAARIKEIERTTNHDVKAVEYRSEERRVGKEWRTRWTRGQKQTRYVQLGERERRHT